MQTLVDTSVWIDFLSQNEPKLRLLLEEGAVCIHPFIIGEIACGSLKNRQEILFLLNSLPVISVSDEKEVMFMLEQNKLFGKGIGWVDMHLLSAALISGCKLWSKDKKLSAAARKLGA